MDKEELMNKADEMRELMGDELFLNELLEAMDVDELKNNLEYIIDQMHDLEIMD